MILADRENAARWRADPIASGHNVRVRRKLDLVREWQSFWDHDLETMSPEEGLQRRFVLRPTVLTGAGQVHPALSADRAIPRSFTVIPREFTNNIEYRRLLTMDLMIDIDQLIRDQAVLYPLSHSF